jgi:hypothetical protein
MRLETENALHRALERDELRIYYQPIIELPGATCSGAEALVRWQHPDRGLVAPDAFIDLAEETGLIVPIGAWVLEEACRQLVAWRTEGVVSPTFSMAINLSARQLKRTSSNGSRLRRADGCSADACLESRASDGQTTIEASARSGREPQHRRLRHRLLVARLLRRFPVDSVKVDRSFVDGLAPVGGLGDRRRRRRSSAMRWATLWPGVEDCSPAPPRGVTGPRVLVRAPNRRMSSRGRGEPAPLATASHDRLTQRPSRRR